MIYVTRLWQNFLTEAVLAPFSTTVFIVSANAFKICREIVAEAVLTPYYYCYCFRYCINISSDLLFQYMIAVPYGTFEDKRRQTRSSISG